MLSLSVSQKRARVEAANAKPELDAFLFVVAELAKEEHKVALAKFQEER